MSAPANVATPPLTRDQLTPETRGLVEIVEKLARQGAQPAEIIEKALALFSEEPPVRTAHTCGGVWLATYSDWSGIAVFGDELEALRYANGRSMQVEFKPWGEIR